jgi:hypothetical protein
MELTKTFNLLYDVNTNLWFKYLLLQSIGLKTLYV